MEQDVNDQNLTSDPSSGNASQAQPSTADRADRDSWYFLPKGAPKKGPYSIEELKEQLASAPFAPGLRIRSGDDTTWCAWDNLADTYPELLKHGVTAEFRTPTEEAPEDEGEDDLLGFAFLGVAGTGWDSENTCDRCGQHSDCRGYPLRIAEKSVEFVDMSMNEQRISYTAVGDEIFWLCKPCRFKQFVAVCRGPFLLFVIALLLTIPCFVVPQLWPEKERLAILYIPGVLLGLFAFSALVVAVCEMCCYPFGHLFHALPSDIEERCKKKAAKRKLPRESWELLSGRQWLRMMKDG